MPPTSSKAPQNGGQVTNWLGARHGICAQNLINIVYHGACIYSIPSSVIMSSTDIDLCSQRQAHGAIPSNTTAASAQQWSKLPPSETTSSKASMPLSRKVISFQVPLSLAALKDDSDDEKEESAVRAAKRLKAAGGGMAKSKLTDFLPPPKNEDITQVILLEFYVCFPFLLFIWRMSSKENINLLKNNIIVSKCKHI